MPYFSIIIAAYNREKLLPATLESIRQQTFTDYEVIVVDDGSSDATSRVAEDHALPVKIIRQKNKGLGAARNAGIRVAEGRYITPLDSDDLWLPWTLETIHEVLQRFDEPAFLTGPFEGFHQEEATRDLARCEPRATLHQDYYHARSRRPISIGVGAVAVRGDEMRQAGGFFEERLWCEDLDMWMRIGDQPGYVLLEQPILMARRMHEGQMIDDLPKLWEGVGYALRQEREGNYPGGAERKSEREQILSATCRALSMRALSTRWLDVARSIYWKTFGMNLKQGRVRYLAAFPFLWLFGVGKAK